VNADKTMYMVMSRDQNERQSHSIKIDNRSFERVEEFKYLGTALINQNSIQKEIKSRLRLGNACYYSMQNLLSSGLLFKNLMIKIYRTIILPFVLYGRETWSLTLREEHKLTGGGGGPGEFGNSEAEMVLIVKTCIHTTISEPAGSSNR